MWDWILANRPDWVSRVVAWLFHKDLLPGWLVKDAFDLMIGQRGKR